MEKLGKIKEVYVINDDEMIHYRYQKQSLTKLSDCHKKPVFEGEKKNEDGTWEDVDRYRCPQCRQECSVVELIEE